jgi:hypothetical protein
LAGTGDLSLIIGKRTPVDHRYLVGFHLNADSSHKNMELDFSGITGIGVFVLDTLLLSRSFVQDQVSVLSCKAEYCACFSAVKDLEYGRLLLRDLCPFPDDAAPPTMLADSEQVMAVSQGPTHRSRAEKIDFTMALVRGYIQHGRAVMEICPTAEQMADMWTKQLGPGPFVVFGVDSWGLFLSCDVSLVLSAIVFSC